MTNQPTHQEAINQPGGGTYFDAMSCQLATRSVVRGWDARLQNDVESAALIIDNAGVVSILLAGCHGRHRIGSQIHPVALRVLLIGMLVLGGRSEQMTVAGAYRLLTEEVSLGMQRRLGVITSMYDPSTGTWINRRVVKLHHLHYVARIITSQLAFTEASAPDVDSAERARCQAVVVAYGEALMGVFRPWWTGNTSVRKFEIASWGRPFQQQRDERRIASDPTWSHRRDVDARRVHRGNQKRVNFTFGYRLVAEMQNPAQDGDGPYLIRQYVVGTMDANLAGPLLPRCPARTDGKPLHELDAYRVARPYRCTSPVLRRGDFQTFGLTWLSLVMGVVNASVNHQNLLQWYDRSRSESSGFFDARLIDAGFCQA